MFYEGTRKAPVNMKLERRYYASKRGDRGEMGKKCHIDSEKCTSLTESQNVRGWKGPLWII